MFSTTVYPTAQQYRHLLTSLLCRGSLDISLCGNTRVKGTNREIPGHDPPSLPNPIGASSLSLSPHQFQQKLLPVSLTTHMPQLPDYPMVEQKNVPPNSRGYAGLCASYLQRVGRPIKMYGYLVGAGCLVLLTIPLDSSFS